MFTWIAGSCNFTFQLPDVCDFFKTPNTTSSLGLRQERQQIYKAGQSNWIEQTANGGRAFCVIVARDKRRGRGTGVGERRGRERESVFLEFRVQFDMSPVLDVRRWPYVLVFHILFLLLIGVQNTACRNTGQLQTKVIQRSHQTWYIQNTHVDTGRNKHCPIKSAPATYIHLLCSTIGCGLQQLRALSVYKNITK